MSLTKALFRYGAIPAGIYIVASVFAFWPSYFSRLDTVPNLAVHVHGWLMAGWLGLLVSQALLVRTGNRAWHRRFGRLSLAYAPVLAGSIVLAAHSALGRASAFDEAAGARLALQLGYVPLFLTIWGIGMRERGSGATHARFMVCTVLPMTSPVFDRILGFYFMPEMAVLPTFPDGSRLLPTIYLILFGLSAWDWRSGERRLVFPLVAALFFAQHTLVLLIHGTTWWLRFVAWFAALPLTPLAGSAS